MPPKKVVNKEQKEVVNGKNVKKVPSIVHVSSDSESESDSESDSEPDIKAKKIPNDKNKKAEKVNANLNQTNWKNDFEDLIKFEKPDDPLDCKVELEANERCDFSKLSDGSLLYRPARLIITEKNRDNLHTRVRNQDLHKTGVDSDWNLGKDLISKQCWTPDQYTKIEKVTASVLAHKLKEEVGDCICKVEFTKNPDVAERATMMRTGCRILENAAIPEAEKAKLYKKLYERVQKGEYRIMRGYIVRSEDMEIEQTDTGMIKFLDAELFAKGEMAERQINIRNIVSLTYKLTKYQLK